MREESHLDEMRSAIRGDFERLAERRGDQELMRVVEEPAEPEPEVEEPLEHVADERPLERAAHEEPEHEPEPDAQTEPRRSWLSRFLSP